MNTELILSYINYHQSVISHNLDKLIRLYEQRIEDVMMHGPSFQSDFNAICERHQLVIDVSKNKIKAANEIKNFDVKFYANLPC